MDLKNHQHTMYKMSCVTEVLRKYRLNCDRKLNPECYEIIKMAKKYNFYEEYIEVSLIGSEMGVTCMDEESNRLNCSISYDKNVGFWILNENKRFLQVQIL